MTALPASPNDTARIPGPSLVTGAPTYDAERTTCVLCGGSDLRPFDQDHRGHRIVRCRCCGVRFMNPQYSDVWLDRFYAGYVPETSHSHDRGWRAQPHIRQQGKERAFRDIERFVPQGRMLLVGCGDGLELRIARQLGWQVVGHDVDAGTTARVAAECGVRVHCGDFPDLAEPDGSFDAVFMDQVIEHPKEPGAFLAKAFRLLRPGGVLYLGQPNIGSLSNGLKTLVGRLGLRRRRRGRHYASQHHITYYSPRVLARQLAASYGFEVLEVRGSPKPARRPWFAWLGRRFPLFDSSFVVIARRP